MPTASKGGLVFLLLLTCSWALAQDVVTARTNYYTVEGNSIAEIYRSMRERRPWKEKLPYDARTAWQIEWRFDLASSPGECRVHNFRSTTTITYTFPRWSPPTNALPAVTQEWVRFFTALQNHEAGHAALALEASRALRQVTNSSFASSDCAALRKEVNSHCDRVIQQHRERERDYDVETRHGAAQGVTLRLPSERARRRFPPR